MVCGYSESDVPAAAVARNENGAFTLFRPVENNSTACQVDNIGAVSFELPVSLAVESGVLPFVLCILLGIFHVALVLNVTLCTLDSWKKFGDY